MQSEPATWRTFTARDCSAQVPEPDLRTVTTLGDYEDHLSLEIELGAESIPAVIRGRLAYQRSKESGIEQARLGLSPGVVSLIGDPRRRERPQAPVRADRRLDAGLLQVIDPNDVQALRSDRASAKK